jgi:hypothetical protein
MIRRGLHQQVDEETSIELLRQLAGIEAS